MELKRGFTLIILIESEDGSGPLVVGATARRSRLIHSHASVTGRRHDIGGRRSPVVIEIFRS